jgi:hypothetical protein
MRNIKRQGGANKWDHDDLIRLVVYFSIHRSPLEVKATMAQTNRFRREYGIWAGQINS